MAHAADKVVHAGDNRLENRTAQDDAHVARSHRQKLVTCAKELEERHHENLAKRKGAHRHNDEQYKGVVEDDGRLLVLAFAETDGKKRVATHANHHGHRHNEKGNRKADGDAADTKATDALTYKIAVHDVVERFNQHADDGRDRKLQDNLRDARRPHRVKFFIVYYIFHKHTREARKTQMVGLDARSLSK